MSESDPLLPVYLIVGSDRPKVRRAVQRLRRHVIAESGSDINISTFEVEKLTTAATLRALIEAADSPGFALGTRLLLVINAHHFNVKERKEILAYIHDPMPGTTLALEAEKWAKEDALYKAVVKSGDVLSYDLPKKYQKAEMDRWVRKRAAAKGLPMSGAVARHLLDVCGEDPAHIERLEREIEKLAAYCHGVPASEEDVDAVCTPDDEARIFDLMDAVGHRNRTRAFGLLESIFASGDPKDDASRVLYTLLRYVRQLEAAWGLGASDQGTAARQLGVAPFVAKKLLEQRKNYDRRRFDKAYRALAVAETGMRGRAPATLETAPGVNHSDRLVVELALARLLS
jgi:DNA polymerase-3 subunit delta